MRKNKTALFVSGYENLFSDDPILEVSETS